MWPTIKNLLVLGLELGFLLKMFIVLLPLLWTCVFILNEIISKTQSSVVDCSPLDQL